MKNKSFAAFILTHGRPHNEITSETLRRHGYTGKIYLIVDNEDKTIDQYVKKYGKENVIVFDKEAAGKNLDLADTQTDRRATVFARNESFVIAKKLGLEYYIQLDDDYTHFSYKKELPTTRTKSNVPKLKSRYIKNLDKVFDAMIDLLNDTNAVSVAMGQGGEYMGGTNAGLWKSGLRRKAMNSWLFKTEQPIDFIGRMNDDVSTYVVHGMRGKLFFTVAQLYLDQAPTQTVQGGMTDIYLASGTYMKTMYTVIMQPSSVKVSVIGSTNKRVHHSIDQNTTYPQIISDKYLAV